MKNLTIGKYNGFQQITSDRGTFSCLALDHRQNLRKTNPAFLDNANLLQFKIDVITALSPKATAILLDPEVSAAQAIAANCIPNNVGLIVAIESTGYTGDSTARYAQIIPGWSVEKAKRMGASAIKLLVYYHPDSPTASEIESFTRKIAIECKNHDIVFMLEPLSYWINSSEKLSSDEKKYVVIETASRMTSLGVDVLKSEFPLDVHENDESLWAEACTEISASSKVPWILLSAAVDYEVFLRQVIVACNSGASGVAVGRAVWQEAVTMTHACRKEFLYETAQIRLERLNSLCYALARPWTDFFTTDPEFDWYREY